MRMDFIVYYLVVMGTAVTLAMIGNEEYGIMTLLGGILMKVLDIHFTMKQVQNDENNQDMEERKRL